ncbi:MAG TPA: hypothetical protein IAC99_03095 [Candidatus Choladocola avistercoris]|nr:hypothetical protein [Candidatus Choladocola avistercoris]
MKQLRKYVVGMLLLAVMMFTAACGSTDNKTDNGSTGVTDENSTTQDTTDEDTVHVDDILFDTDGDGVYDHTDVDGDGLLEEIGRDTNDVVDDVVDDLTGNDMTEDGTVDDTVVEENGATQEKTEP